MPKYLKTQDVCDILHISRKKAYDLFKVKGFPYIKIGRDYLVDESEFEQFMKNHRSSTIYIN